MVRKVNVVSSSGKVVMPAELRVEGDLQSGDKVVFTTDDQGQIVISKQIDL